MTKTPRLLASLLLLGLLIVVAGPAHAGGVNAFWKELGASASGGGISQLSSTRYATPPSVALGLDGRPVVAYGDSPETSEGFATIIVKRWTGAAWQTLSPAGGIGTVGDLPQVRISGNGTIYVAWLVNDAVGATVHLRRRTATGTVWEQLAGSDSPGGITNTSVFGSFSLAVASDGNPMVAFVAGAQTGVVYPAEGILQESLVGQVYVKKYTAAGGWQYLGSDPTSGGGASNASSFLVNAGASYAVHGADGVVLAVDHGGAPTAAFRYRTSYPHTAAPAEFAPSNSDLYVTRYNGSAWSAVGPVVPPSDDAGPGRGGPGGITGTAFSAYTFDFAADPASDHLWVAWMEYDNTVETPIYVRRWNGVDTWEELSGSASGSGISGGGSNEQPAVRVDQNGNAIVAWRHEVSGAQAVGQLFVLRSNAGGGWDEMGPDSASGDGISAYPPGSFVDVPVLAHFHASTGTPPDNTTVAWSGGADPTQVFLRQFTDGPRFLLSTSVVPGGSGRIVSNPIGIACPEDSCSEFYPSGQVVGLTAIPGPDALLDKWTGACTGSAACNVPMIAARNVSANFVGAGTLVVSKTGLGTVSGLGIACGSDCQEKYKTGTLVTLTAAMPAGTLFNGWGGACAFRGKNTSCPLTITGNASVLADFSQRQYHLALNVTGLFGTNLNGDGGRVTSLTGPFLNCGRSLGDTCTAEVDHGTHVVFRSAPDPANRFVKYDGQICNGSTNPICDFTMVANYSANVLFAGVTTIELMKTGNAANKSMVTGPGINCGADCIGAIDTGTKAVFTATPAVGSKVTAWGGQCIGYTGNTCNYITQGENQSVTVDFKLNRHHLQVTGEGFGYTQSNIPGIDCGSVPGHFDCGEDYDYGTTVALVPTPGTDSMFVNWTGCSRLNGSTCFVDMTANHSVHKKFAPARLLSLSASGNGHGRLLVPGKPPVPCTGCSASFLLPYSATVPTVVSATPDVGSNFRWVSAPVSSCIGKSTPCSFPMSQNQTVVGSFALNRHSLAVTSRLNGSVVGNFGPPDPFGVICGSGENLCATTQNYGTVVNLLATANDGFKFINWTGTSPCAVGTRAFNASCSFTLLGNTTVIPNYRAATEIELDKLGSGTVAVTGVLSPAVVSCGPTCSNITFTAFDGKLVTLKATPSIGWSAVGYSGDCVSNSSVCAYVPAGSANAITALFEVQQFAVNVVSRLNGSVVGTTAAGTIITCGSSGGDCTETLDFGTPVSVVATANAGFVFVNWTGDAVCAGKTTPTCAFSVPNRIVTVTPNYRPRTGVTLLKGSGNGSGTLTATGTLLPAVVSCGPTCSSTSFAALDGKVVALKAMPSVGSSFVGFTGDCTSNTSACSFLPVGANDSVTGTFVLQQFQLAVTNRGNGSVTSNPTGAIDCGASGADCGETVNYGAPVSVVADPNDGFVFVNWTGDAVCAAKTTPTCSFAMPLRNVTVTPNYRARTLVNVVSDGGSLDLVVSTPAGIKCPGDCSEAFFNGVLVTLTATAGLGKDFQGFSGVTCLPPPGNISTPNVCRFFPTGDSQNISASFVLETRTVNLSVTGNGQVTSGVFGCDEPSSPCAFNGSYGTQVVFVAAPAPGQRLLNWTGCTSTNASFCTVLLNQVSGNKTVTAAFGPIPAALIAVGDGGVRTFGPHTVTVTVGQVVEWDWKSPNHNVVSGDTTTGDADNQFCSPDDTNCATTPLLTTNSFYTHTFAVPGTYNYFCRAHRTSGMVGTIIVNPPE